MRPSTCKANCATTSHGALRWLLPLLLQRSTECRGHYSTFYYIPINVITLDTVDFTECNPMLRITILWFSESISPLSDTDDVVHNVQCMRYCDVIHIAPYKICTKYFICFKMKPINPTPKHKCIFLMLLECFSTQDLTTIVLLKFVFSLENKCLKIEPRYLYQSFSIIVEGYIINLLW